MLANADEIAQICLHLCFNADDVSDAHGQIDVTVEPGTTAGFTCASCLSDVSGQRWVSIAVCDHAGGINSITRRRTFDPFYTNKGPHASGLGLSMVHGLVHRHGGHLLVDSRLGLGPKFSVRLPTA